MKKYSFLVIMLSACFLFSGCYHIDSSEIDEYKSFVSEMEDKNQEICSFIPNFDGTDYIDDVYLYYSDYDLFDSLYAVYVNCSYDEKRYNQEIERLNLSWNSKDANKNDFGSNAIVYESSNDVNNYIRCTYAIHDDDNYQIIYVTIFSKGDFGHIVENIPSEYLPYYMK